ncbi:MAG: cytochrome c peroxidase, partial [Saprospiraceae bacterium]|nr:cytochrome c peroxidase [Saprospiraceae bacterium]
AAGFQAGIPQGIGEGGSGFGNRGEARVKHGDYAEADLDVQPIRTPSAMNTSFQDVMLWNGQFGATGTNQGTEASWTADTPKEVNHLGYEGLESQAIAGLKVHRMEVEEMVLVDLGYKDLFDQAFPDFPEDKRYTRETTGLAIAAFERTLYANQAPFQRWLKGEMNAMNEAELRGALLFFGKAECGSCHTGPALNKMEFHALGMNDLHDFAGQTFKNNPEDPGHLGRGGFTNRSADMFKFKVPQLYNLADSPFYGHGSSFQSIREVIEYKNDAIAENPDVPAAQLSPDFTALGLSDNEISDIVAFLEGALYDPDLERYNPDAVLSGNCFPVNDDAARQDLGCE